MPRNSLEYNEESSIYQPLPRGNFTRVLVLEPGSGQQSISCKLKFIDLNDPPDFEAISYVWGSRRKSRTIFCNGIATKITHNLLRALRRVRHASKPRMVWADSICINQDEDGEKNHQVALMGQIYSQAHRVLIHIVGNDKAHAPCAASLISETAAMIRQTHQEIGPGKGNFPWPTAEAVRSMMNDTRWESFSILLQQPWFLRGWVVQEAALAQDAVVLWGAHTEIDWCELMRCYAWTVMRAEKVMLHFQLKRLSMHEALYYLRNPDEARSYKPWHIKGVTFLAILHRARRTQLEDPRDRIFAFWSLNDYIKSTSAEQTSKSIDRITLPDYTQSKDEIYTDFARQYLLTCDNKILNYVQHTSDSLLNSVAPSWVPRWDFDIYHVPSPYGKPALRPQSPAENNAARKISILEGNILVIRGVILDRVEARSEIPKRPFKMEDMLSIWRTVESSNWGSVYAAEHREIAFISTLCKGSHEGKSIDWLAEEDACSTFLRESGHLGDKVPGEVSFPRIQSCIPRSSWNRSLVSTSRGYFGNCPAVVEEGDICCIIFGCTTPFILREVESNQGRQCYRLIGYAWIPGISPIQTHSYNTMPLFGREESKEWVEWGLEEQDIYIC